MDPVASLVLKCTPRASSCFPSGEGLTLIIPCSMPATWLAKQLCPVSLDPNSLAPPIQLVKQDRLSLLVAPPNQLMLVLAHGSHAGVEQAQAAALRASGHQTAL
mmetsp:Transcript_15462/g.41883  ORF Transcript_15462/g.41883 Transcript_15462/m.41883 type:complete len:104 (-) Transcript_15462:58-369(-)